MGEPVELATTILKGLNLRKKASVPIGNSKCLDFNPPRLRLAFLKGEDELSQIRSYYYYCDPGPERLGGGRGHQVARCQRRRGPYPWSIPLVTPPEGVVIRVLEHSNN